ncbi:uncharacterized protein KD926_002375 [Aspergillus affinis]|uniref:uncharacterized protein n=1 Tax=Aspergillus affinis TaxID=1070780 RepID=UPI0022FE48FD|nr:uncharacterized protein KD926_002375 [Aspergillus affinis]KAI9043996.1 hypothetical protein KD926_002375 [Aspergillus affinis]
MDSQSSPSRNSSTLLRQERDARADALHREGVFQKAYMELFHRHEEDRMGNPYGENAKDALRVRFWMETKDQDPGDAETFEELMHIVNDFIESDDPDRPVFEDEAVHLGDILDVIIKFGETEKIVDIKFLLNKLEDQPIQED